MPLKDFEKTSCLNRGRGIVQSANAPLYVSVQIEGKEDADKRKRHSLKGLRPLARQAQNKEASYHVSATASPRFGAIRHFTHDHHGAHTALGQVVVC